MVRMQSVRRNLDCRAAGPPRDEYGVEVLETGAFGLKCQPLPVGRPSRSSTLFRIEHVQLACIVAKPNRILRLVVGLPPVLLASKRNPCTVRTRSRHASEHLLTSR